MLDSSQNRMVVSNAALVNEINKIDDGLGEGYDDLVEAIRTALDRI